MECESRCSCLGKRYQNLDIRNVEGAALLFWRGIGWQGHHSGSEEVCMNHHHRNQPQQKRGGAERGSERYVSCPFLFPSCVFQATRNSQSLHNNNIFLVRLLVGVFRYFLERKSQLPWISGRFNSCLPTFICPSSLGLSNWNLKVSVVISWKPIPIAVRAGLQSNLDFSIEGACCYFLETNSNCRARWATGTAASNSHPLQ